MAPTAPLPALTAARQRLWLPPLALSGCIRAAFLRDTRGVPMSAAQRYNHFPASPLVSLSWWFTGRSLMLEPGGPAADDTPRSTLPGRFVLAGPHTAPTISFNDGPVHALMLMLQPDAVYRLTGIAASSLVNRMIDAETVLPEPWIGLCHAVQTAPDDDARLRALEDFFRPRWAAADARRASGRYTDWVEGLALHAATTSAGRSLRQVERRIKQWAGLPLRELQAIARSERTFFQVLEAAGEGRIDWAEVAAEGGYADQSHLCRASRRVTGFSPAELRRRVEHDETFWAYRVWE